MIVSIASAPLPPYPRRKKRETQHQLVVVSIASAPLPPSPHALVDNDEMFMDCFNRICASSTLSTSRCVDGKLPGEMFQSHLRLFHPLHFPFLNNINNC